jgi:hypothetical protein
MTQIPSVGRQVHYVSYGSVGGRFKPACRAATITEVRGTDLPGDPRQVGLMVANPTGLFFHPIDHDGGPCPYDEGEDQGDGTRTYKGGSWHWPERV